MNTLLQPAPVGMLHPGAKFLTKASANPNGDKKGGVYVVVRGIAAGAPNQTEVAPFNGNGPDLRRRTVLASSVLVVPLIG